MVTFLESEIINSNNNNKLRDSFKKWNKIIHNSYDKKFSLLFETYNIGQAFRFLDLFIGELPFQYKVSFFSQGEGEVFLTSYIHWAEIERYYTIITPIGTPIKDKVILKIPIDTLHLTSTKGRNKMINEFKKLYENNYLKKPKINCEPRWFNEDKMEIQI